MTKEDIRLDPSDHKTLNSVPGGLRRDRHSKTIVYEIRVKYPKHSLAQREIDVYDPFSLYSRFEDFHTLLLNKKHFYLANFVLTTVRVFIPPVPANPK